MKTARNSKTILLLALLLVPVLAVADEWVPLNDKYGSEIDPITVQQGQRPETNAHVIAIWVRTPEQKLQYQVWVDCGMRQAQTYTDIWSAWKPIAPESTEWAIWERLCKQPKKKSQG